MDTTPLRRAGIEFAIYAATFGVLALLIVGVPALVELITAALT